MRTRRGVLLAAIGFALVLGACDDKQEAAAPPPPQALTASAIGHYCGMNVLEHPGPKGQILLESRLDPVWFSSARDTLAFTMLAEEPKDIRAIYVSDMARAPNWENPGAENWVDARRAFYVIGSDRQGGMGAPEAVPFSDRAAAERLVAEHGGRIVTFSEMPRHYVLEAPPDDPAATVHAHGGGE
ncbi:MAG: nitrous oxide reductase accessory protein NosL [Acetobacteraceae bacterium]|nr:nitrous oxide reductase accessory protein NosL [Acetobacteraceae bacterium]